MSNTVQTERMRELLQPDVVVELGEKVFGPLDLLRLKERLNERRPSPGEPCAVAEPRIQRMIQLKPETWEALNQLADRLQAQGTRATPSQVAALLIESSLAKLESEARE